MTVSITERLSEEIKLAMRARNSDRLSALRMLQAAIKQKEVDDRKELSDSEVIAIVERQVKQRRESIAAFEQAGRSESAAKEQAELNILQEFMPEAASQDEVMAVIEAALAEVRASGITGGAAMGKVMGMVKEALAGRADMSTVSSLVRQKINENSGP